MDYTPLYIQVKQYIIDKIESGEYGVDEKLPTGKELRKIFDVSTITIDTAMKELVKEGYVYRKKGLGTYVNHSIQNKNLSEFFSYEFENLRHQEIEQNAHKTLSIKTNTPSSEIAKKLGIDSTDIVNEIIRFRLDYGTLMSIEYIYIPLRIVGELTMDDDPGSGYIYQYLFNNFNVLARNIKSFFRVGSATPLETEHFSIPQNEKLLVLEHFLYNNDGNVISYAREVVNSSRFNLFLNINIPSQDMI